MKDDDAAPVAMSWHVWLLLSRFLVSARLVMAATHCLDLAWPPKRRLEHNEAATSAALSHQVTMREQKVQQQQQLKEILDELTKSLQKIAKGHAMVCLSNVCEPDWPSCNLAKKLWVLRELQET